MRRLLIITILAGFGFLFLRQQQDEKAADNPVAAQAARPASPAPAPRGQASQYNYMKRALDRAHDVRDDARARTQDPQNP